MNMSSISPRTLQVLCLLIATVFCVGTSSLVKAAEKDMVFYVGGEGDQTFHDVQALSDGTFLISGSCTNLDWLPDGAKKIELAGPKPNSEATDRYPILLQVSSDLSSVLAVAYMPKGSAETLTYIRTTEVPGKPTGDLYFSGDRKGTDRPGYFIAKLDGNFVDKMPSKLLWVVDARAVRSLEKFTPWDVGGDGKVVYADGESYGYSWLAVYRLTPDGKQDIVPNWRTHWGEDSDGKGFEKFGELGESVPDTITHSGIVLKTWGRGDFRSWSKEDFLLKTSDGNGGVKQGKWPFDAMFDGYFDPETKKSVRINEDKKGYYGYRWTGVPCAHVGAIAIDRRNNHMYIGGNNRSRLPDGNPDFEPWLVAMDQTGKLKWWQRLYSEEKGVSTPDQYVDAIAIDYSKPVDEASLVVAARAHGNNVNNYWNGDSVQHKDNPGFGFQNGFTGTHGNMHFSWLGRLSLDKGTLLNASYFAEYAEGAKHGKSRFNHPLLRDWPDFKSAWADLNSTRVKVGSLEMDQFGNPHVLALGRRVITTSNAYQQMPSPTKEPGSIGVWSDFVRTYEPDLTWPKYSSILTGVWDTQTGKDGSKVVLTGLTPTKDGVLVVGYAPVDKDSGLPQGQNMPLHKQPNWGTNKRQGSMAVVALLHFDKQDKK